MANLSMLCVPLEVIARMGNWPPSMPPNRNKIVIRLEIRWADPMQVVRFYRFA